MERVRDQSPVPTQAGNVGVTVDALEKDPEIYYFWMLWTLETGFADRDAETMVDMLGRLNDMTSGREGLSPKTWPEGVRQDIQSVARKLRTEVETRTRGAVAELNLAREVYADQLPDMFVKITDNPDWHRVEGFAMSGYCEIHPIINGQTYKDFVLEVQRHSDLDEQY